MRLKQDDDPLIVAYYMKIRTKSGGTKFIPIDYRRSLFSPGWVVDNDSHYLLFFEKIGFAYKCFLLQPADWLTVSNFR